MQKPGISVVVCTKNEEAWVEACLKCLLQQTIPAEIIVVDGYSSDDTRAIAKKYASKIVFDNKQGIADARNAGWQNASAEIVAYCDIDCLPREDWCENILAEFLSDSKLAALSGPLLAHDGPEFLKTNFDFWAGFFPLLTASCYPNIWGANMAFRKSALQKVPFAEKFLEDFDIRCRMRAAGLKIKFSNSMLLPASTRRFKTTAGFYRVCVYNYLYYSLKKTFTGKSGLGYYEENFKS